MSIQELYARDKNLWCRTFFPEYADVFGGYPKGIPVRYGLVSGVTGAAEMTPWSLWGMSALNDVQANGTRSVPGAEPRTVAVETVSEADYLAWCNKVSFFRNGGRTPLGGAGLHPEVFVGAVDIRYGAYWLRQARYTAQSLLVKPDYVTCPMGIYLPMRGPTKQNPWGVNSAFVPKGYKIPAYLSDRFGPDNYEPPAYVPLPRDATGQVVIPTQAEYDRARYSVYL